MLKRENFLKTERNIKGEKKRQPMQKLITEELQINLTRN